MKAVREAGKFAAGLGMVYGLVWLTTSPKAEPLLERVGKVAFPERLWGPSK